MKDQLFTTREVSRRTKASLRQLQWWDEQGYVVAHRAEKQNRRLYDEDQIKRIERLVRIREVSGIHYRMIPRGDINTVKVIDRPTIVNGVLCVPRIKRRLLPSRVPRARSQHCQGSA